MKLLPKYIKYKIASVLSTKDLFNFHLTSRDNYQLYRSADFWANKLKMTTLDWQNRVDRSGVLCYWPPDNNSWEYPKNVYRYRTIGTVWSCIDVFGNLYLMDIGYLLHIFGQDLGPNWTKVSVEHKVEDFICAESLLLLTIDHELHIIGDSTTIVPAVKEIGWVSDRGDTDITYFLTFQGQLYVIDDSQTKIIATNVTHVLAATYSDVDLYYVIQSTHLWRYDSHSNQSKFELEFDRVLSLYYDQNHLYINESCYIDTGDILVKDNNYITQKGIVYKKFRVTYDDVNKTLTVKDSDNVICHIDDEVLKVFIEDDNLCYIKKQAKLLLPKT